MLVPIFLILVFTNIATSRSINQSFSNRTEGCFSQNREHGRCMPLRNCPFLKDMIDDLPPKLVMSKIKEYVCGFKKEPVQVCCPTSQIARRTNHRNRRLLPEDCGMDVRNKIIGGRETSLDEYPWMALLRFKKGFSCGGSLISSRYVLTAAHCLLHPRIPVAITQVRLGEHDQTQELDCVGHECSTQPDDIDVEEQIVHPNYNPRDSSSQNDIALIRLKRPANFSRFIQPICLPLDDLSNKDFDGQEMWIAGWGKTTNGINSQSAVKQKVQLPVVPLSDCAPIYRKENAKLTDKQICAGGTANEDACKGDSGGPLMRQDVVGSTIRWHVQGIISFGPTSCGNSNAPGIYTKVGKYLNWILDNMRV